MKLIDTHAHLQFAKFNEDREEVVKRTSQELEAIIMPGAKIDSSEASVKLAQQVPNFYAAVGVHPHHAGEWQENWSKKLGSLITEDKVVAVGEVGLDNYRYKDYPTPDLKNQLEILIPQIELARAHNKPILFHCRQAYDELYEAIERYQPLTGLVHCFMGDKTVAKKFVDLGLYISFAGNLTYPQNDHMREAAAFLPEDKIVIETDSPYLAPEGLRGQRNEPVNVHFVAEIIARVKKIDLEKVALFTVTNSKKLFKI
ncbi:MAG TPA: TatD family hydrolase [Candidatus Nanoarchaeia archaeon]